jgi:hypothetical protein
MDVVLDNPAFKELVAATRTAERRQMPYDPLQFNHVGRSQPFGTRGSSIDPPDEDSVMATAAFAEERSIAASLKRGEDSQRSERLTSDHKRHKGGQNKLYSIFSLVYSL